MGDIPVTTVSVPAGAFPIVTEIPVTPVISNVPVIPVTVAGVDGSPGAPGAPGRVGQDGDPGQDGDQGPPGPKGADGAKGADGTQGVDGAQGAQGIQGVQGIQGFQGPPGNDGADGDDGLPGPAGAQGVQGPAGAGLQGQIGPPGADGQDGQDGLAGPQGAQGSQGVQGIQGFQGQPGNDGLDGDDGIPGPAGAAGAQGNTGSPGSQGVQGVPGNDGSDGIDGDQGPPGPQGSQGIQGVQGIQGFQGPPGYDGLDGDDGFPGPAGAVGPQGTQGLTGSGIQGPPGNDGADGIDGDVGPQGIQGVQGIQGIIGLPGSTGAATNAFLATKNGNSQSVTGQTETKATFTTEAFDNGGYYDAPNSRWTPPAGPILITAQVGFTVTGGSFASPLTYVLSLWKNGGKVSQTTQSDTVSPPILNLSYMDNASGTDFYEIEAQTPLLSGGVGTAFFQGSTQNTFFSGCCLLGPVGATGPQGRPGEDAAEGPEGPPGPQGIQGVQGIQGNTGATGNQTVIVQGDDTLMSDDNPLALLNNMQSPVGLDAGEFMVVLNSGFTMNNALGAQKAFNATTNGAVTLAGGTLYEFEAEYYITDAGTTSHTWGVLFGGTATITNGAMHAESTGAATGANAVSTALGGGSTATLGTSLPCTPAVTTAFVTTIKVRGIVRINAAGTFIPQVAASAAPGAAPTMGIGSFFRIAPVGASATTFVGPWT